MACRARRHRILVTLWLLWAIALLAVYYKQLWHLFVLGPSAWVADNYSLASVPALWYLFTAGPSAWGLPALGEALTRTLAAVFGSGLVLLTAQVLGIGICWLLRWYPEDWREGLLYRTAIGLGAVSYLSLGLAALGLYYAVSVRILIAVVLLGGGLWFFYSWVRSGFSRRQVEALPKPASMGHYRAGDKVWQVIALLAVLIAFMTALAPEIEGDALWYHLWLPKLWLEQGRPVDVIAEFISLYPLTWELIFAAGLVLGGPVAAKLLHFVLLPLTGLLVYQLTRRFVPRASPWLAVALFVTVPTVLWEATTAYVDLALAMHVGLVVYALLRYVEGRSWQWFALAVLNLGLALATKHLGLFVLAITTTGLALRLWLEDRSLRWALVPAVLLGLLSLLLPLPWYLRSWLASGNPVFPDLYGIFGAFPPERWNEIAEQGWRHFEARFGRPRTALNQLTLLWDMTVHAARYDGTLGPLFLLLLPALILVRRRSRVIPWLIAFVLVYIALWSSPLNGLEMRFLIPLTPLLAVLAAEASDRLMLLLRSTLARWDGKAFQGGMAVLLLFNLPPFTSLHEGDRVVWDGWLTHVVHEVPLGVVVGRESQEDYLAQKVPSYAAWRYINTHLPDDARVLTFSGGDHFYSERDRIGDAATMAYTAVWGSTQGQERQALQTIHQLGISHVLFDKRLFEAGWMDDLVIAQPAVMAEWYELWYEDDRFALYRLRWEHLASQLQGFHTLQDGIVEPQTTLILAQDQAPANVADSSLVTQEIRYHMPEAGEVLLVWGINGWAVVPEENRPAGTLLKNDVMHTPMVREGDTFVAKVQVPSGATIDYGFLITETRNGAAVHVWEADGAQDYHTIAIQDGVVEVKTTLTLAQDQASATVADSPLVTQEIRYHMPEAGEVFLAWGINGWTIVPKEIRPAGTMLKNDVMHTPMTHEGDTFVAKVQVPSGATIEYGFLITKKRSGAGIEAAWDGHQDYQMIAAEGGVTEVQTTLTLAQAKELASVLDVGLHMLIGVCIVLGIGVMLIPIPHNRRAVTLALIGLTLLGLALRLRVAGTSQRLLDAPARLIGDESRYDNLAYALLQGDFFQSPAAPPVYPLFLAACYLVFGHVYAAVLSVQALIGAAAIPLTYRLARRFTGRSSLLAAELVALNPILIYQVGNLHTEVLYTFLLLLTLLGLLWALEAPLLRRFLLAGVLLGISTLCRSATALMPLFLPLILPRVWSLRRRVALCVVYGGAMVAVIAPWTCHNYRTYNTFMPFSLSLTMLWQGSPEFYHVMEQKQNAILQVWYEELNPERNGGHDPFTIEGERYFNARAIASIRAEPGVYAWYSLQKLAFFWIGHPAADWEWPFDFDGLRTYFSAEQIAGLFASRLLPLVALVGLIALRRRLRPFGPLLAVCGYFMLIYAILNAESRYSTPLYPILIVIIAAAASEAVCRYQAHRQRSRAQHRPR